MDGRAMSDRRICSRRGKISARIEMRRAPRGRHVTVLVCLSQNDASGFRWWNLSIRIPHNCVKSFVRVTRMRGLSSRSERSEREPARWGATSVGAGPVRAWYILRVPLDTGSQARAGLQLRRGLGRNPLARRDAVGRPRVGRDDAGERRAPAAVAALTKGNLA